MEQHQHPSKPQACWGHVTSVPRAEQLFGALVVQSGGTTENWLAELLPADELLYGCGVGWYL